VGCRDDGHRAAIALAIAAAGHAAPAHRVLPVFHAPAGEQVLTRTLRRQLADGGSIVTMRRYAIRFVPAGDGYRVEGRQLDARVEAPAKGLRRNK